MNSSLVLGNRKDQTMYYIYSKRTDNGRVDFLRAKDTWQDAIELITLLYNQDRNSCERGCYYYYIVER